MTNLIPDKSAAKPVFPGRTVYYHDAASAALLVATVVYVHESSLLNLWVLPNGVSRVGNAFLARNVAQGEGEGCWRHLPHFA